MAFLVAQTFEQEENQMSEQKLTFDEAMDEIANERKVKPEEVLASAMNRVVWQAEWHLWGDYTTSYSLHTSKRAAVEAALAFMEDPLPRGAITALNQPGHETQFVYRTKLYGTVVTTVSRHRLGDWIRLAG